MSKTLLAVAALFFMLVGCEAPKPETPPETDSPTTTEAAAEASVAEADMDAPTPTGYNEYIWCVNGENFSEEAYAARTAYWVNAVNELGMQSLRAIDLTPSDWQSENFERVTLLMWADKAERDAGWAAYLEAGVEAAMNEEFPDVEICGGENWANVYGHDKYAPRPATVSWDAETHPAALAGYQFCSFTEGSGPAQLREIVRDDFIPYVDAYEADNGPTTYTFGVLVPQFEMAAVERHEDVPMDVDFVWLNFWGDPAERNASDDTWAEKGAEIQAAFDEVADCSADQFFYATLTKAGAA